MSEPKKKSSSKKLKIVVNKNLTKQSSVSSEEFIDLAETVIENVSNVLDNKLGKGNFVCYMSVAFKKPTTGINSKYSTFSITSKPDENLTEEECMEEAEILRDMLANDPIVMNVALHSAVDRFIDSCGMNISKETEIQSPTMTPFNPSEGVH